MRFKFVDNLKETIDDYIDFGCVKDPSYFGELSDNIANDIKFILQDIILNNNLNEQFVSHSDLINHFNAHCKGGVKGGHVKSSRSNIIYDFNTLAAYKNYEQYLSNYFNNDYISIPSLTDTTLVLNSFRKFFEHEICLVFETSCGLHNGNGPIRLCLHSYAEKVTTNYLFNTVDFCVMSSTNKTITLFAVDANYLQNKLNNVINNYSNYKQLKFYFNH